MQTRAQVFTVEGEVPGAFLAQGMAGGVLAGCALMTVVTLWTIEPDPFSFLAAAPIVIFAAGVGGVFTAIAIWAAYYLLGLEMRPATRIVATVLTIRVITILLGLRWSVADPTYFTLGTAIALLMGLPTALLVGSGVKPWRLFTFGSITDGPPEHEQSLGSDSIFGTLGTLPLRFLSLAAIVAWVLFISIQRELKEVPVAAAALVFPAIYPALSAYLTFKSPSKPTLLAIGLVVNIPIGLIALFGDGKKHSLLFGDVFFFLPWICLAFIVAWTIFLIARLSARPRNPLLALDDVLRDLATKPAAGLDQHLPYPRLVFGKDATLLEESRK